MTTLSAWGTKDSSYWHLLKYHPSMVTDFQSLMKLQAKVKFFFVDKDFVYYSQGHKAKGQGQTQRNCFNCNHRQKV